MNGYVWTFILWITTAVYQANGETGKDAFCPLSRRIFLIRESWFKSNYSLSQNGWDTLGSPCPLNVGVQDLVTKPR